MVEPLLGFLILINLNLTCYCWDSCQVEFSAAAGYRPSSSVQLLGTGPARGHVLHMLQMHLWLTSVGGEASLPFNRQGMPHPLKQDYVAVST